MNTAKQMLWLPTSREEKYKAKQAIDTFFVRSGDMLAAGVVFLGTHVVEMGVPEFAAVNILAVIPHPGGVRAAAAGERAPRRLAATPPRRDRANAHTRCWRFAAFLM